MFWRTIRHMYFLVRYVAFLMAFSVFTILSVRWPTHLDFSTKGPFDCGRICNLSSSDVLALVAYVLFKSVFICMLFLPIAYGLAYACRFVLREIGIWPKKWTLTVTTDIVFSIMYLYLSAFTYLSASSSVQFLASDGHVLVENGAYTEYGVKFAAFKFFLDGITILIFAYLAHLFDRLLSDSIVKPLTSQQQYKTQHR